MVQSVVAPQGLEAAFEARAATAATTAVAEWGFLVGHPATPSHRKEYVLACVPATEGEGATSDDLVDQASQAVRMLVGGVRLLGLYHYGPDGAPALESLRRNAAAVQAALADEVGSEWVVLHVAFGARKYTAKSLSSEGRSTLKPADWKFASAAQLGKFHSFATSLKVHLRAPLGAEADAAAVHGRLKATAAAQCAAYAAGAAVMIDGACVDGGVALSALKGGRKTAQGCVQHAVEVFAPNLGRPVAPQTSGGNAPGGAEAEVFGALTLRCVLHEKATVGDAVAMLWQDMGVTLRARLSMQAEMLTASRHGEASASAAFGQPVALPRRLLINTSAACKGVGVDCCFADHLYAADSYGAPSQQVF